MSGILLGGLFGVAPALLFFFWAFQGCRLPWFPTYPLAVPAEACVGWNLFVFLMYGGLHTLTAHLGLARLPYLAVAGLTALAVVVLWQPCTGALWLAGGLQFAWWWGTAQFALWLAVHVWIVGTVGLPSFLGWEAGPKEFVVRGPYRWVRHPMHLNILAHLLLTPAMTNDRLTLLFAVGLYLAAAVPEEEARLAHEFGPAWTAYAKKTPALLPGWRV